MSLVGSNLKILLIPSWYPNLNNASAGIFFAKQAELLSKNHEVRILVGREVVHGYRKAISKPGNLLTISHSQTNHFLDKVERVKLDQFEYTTYAFHAQAGKYERTAASYEKYFSQNILPVWKPDIIHAHDVFMAGVAALRIKEVHDVPVVLTSHNPINFDRMGDEGVKKFKSVIQAVDQLITVSDYDKRILLNSAEKDIHPVTVGNYIDETIFEQAPKETSFRKNLLYVASSSRRKDFPTLIEALSILHSTNPQQFCMDLVISDVQDGITLQDIRKMIEEKDLTNKVKIHSGISLADLRLLYKKTDLYVSSSYLETFGVTVAEAMACGIPVVAADNGGIRDIIDSEQLGLIVPIQNPVLLANAITRFLSGNWNPDRKKISESIHQRYGSKSYLNQLNNIYNQIVR